MPKYYFNRLEHLSSLIKMKATGSPVALARKLGVSERTVYEYVDILRSLGADIKYSKTKESYYYEKDGDFDFKFKQLDALKHLDGNV